MLDVIFFTLTFLPFIPFFSVWLIYKKVLRKPKDAVKMAMDVTTFFLIPIVSDLYNNLTASHFGFYLIAIILLVAFGLLGGIQFKLKGKLDPWKITRTIWRIAFLILACLYIVLMIISLTVYLAQAFT